MSLFSAQLLINNQEKKVRTLPWQSDMKRNNDSNVVSDVDELFTIWGAMESEHSSYTASTQHSYVSLTHEMENLA